MFTNGKPPKDLDLDMAAHVSNAILSLTRYVFVDEEGVYKIFINAMKELERKEWKLWFFARKNLSLFTFLGFVLP